MSSATGLRLTPAEFIEWEERQEGKHEYYRGEVFAMAGEVWGMAGGTESHARLITNLVLLLGNKLKGTGCTVYTDALRVRVEAEDLFTYPDLSVVCGPGTFYDEHRTTLLDPAILVEVLSHSTQTYDRTTKWRFYRQIPSLRAYVLVAQDARAVDLYVRDADGWRVLSEGDDGTLALPDPGSGTDLLLHLDGIYEGVTFPDAPDRPTTT